MVEPVDIAAQLVLHLLEREVHHAGTQDGIDHLVAQCGKQQMLGRYQSVVAGVGKDECRSDNIFKIG